MAMHWQLQKTNRYPSSYGTRTPTPSCVRWSPPWPKHGFVMPRWPHRQFARQWPAKRPRWIAGHRRRGRCRPAHVTPATPSAKTRIKARENERKGSQVVPQAQALGDPIW